MKKEYIKPLETIYQVGLRKGTCQSGSILISSEEDEEDSRQARCQNTWTDENNNSTGTSTNVWDNKW